MEYLEFWEFSLALTYAYYSDFIIHFYLMSLVSVHNILFGHMMRCDLYSDIQISPLKVKNDRLLTSVWQYSWLILRLLSDKSLQ